MDLAFALANLYKRKVRGWRRPEERWNKATPDRCNSSSHGNPRQFSKGRRELHWEKQFCKINGVDWEQVLEAKRLLPEYPKIVDWDDSAGKEAFENAKARYWADINSIDQHENNPLPDPDLLTDPIDPDETPSNPDLLADSSDSNEWGKGGVILWDCHYSKKKEEEEEVSVGMNHRIIPTGWGDIPAKSGGEVTADGLDGRWGVEPTCSWANIPQISSTKIIATGWMA